MTQERLDALMRALPTVLLLGALILGGWLAARWFWYYATPMDDTAPAPPRERVNLTAASDVVVEAHLFGVAASGDTGVVISNLNIKLKGVFASTSDAPAFAIVNTGDKDQTARAGWEIVPGVTLASVHPEYVMLQRNGALERVNLESQIVAPAGAAPIVRAPPQQGQFQSRGAHKPPPAPRSAGAEPPPYKEPTATSRWERKVPEPYAPVGDAPAPPPPPPADATSAVVGTATPVVQSSSQGLVIQSVPTGSALERFGLQPGDVIRSLNGERVTSEADIARIMRERGLQGPYTAEVVRGGLTIPIAVGGGR